MGTHFSFCFFFHSEQRCSFPFGKKVLMNERFAAEFFHPFFVCHFLVKVQSTFPLRVVGNDKSIFAPAFQSTNVTFEPWVPQEDFRQNMCVYTKCNNSRNFSPLAQCLKITEKVALNSANEASFVYILSGQKLVKNAKNGPFWRIWKF